MTTSNQEVLDAVMRLTAAVEGLVPAAKPGTHCKAGAVKRQAARNAIQRGSGDVGVALAPIVACSCVTCAELSRGYDASDG